MVVTFRFSGFGKSIGLFGSSAGQDGAGAFGGEKGGLFGGLKDAGLFSFGKSGHADGARDWLGGNRDFGRDEGSDHDNDKDHDDDHDKDREYQQHDTGTGSSTLATGWPEIPADTAGITFAVDYESDGITDSNIPIGRTSDTKTFEDYLAKARDQVAAENPDVDPKEVIFKATITARSGEETYYYFTGNEESGPVEEVDDEGDDGCGDHEGDGHGRDQHARGDEDQDDAGKCHADFFNSLTGGGKSFDCGRDDDDHWADEDRDQADEGDFL